MRPWTHIGVHLQGGEEGTDRKWNPEWNPALPSLSAGCHQCLSQPFLFLERENHVHLIPYAAETCPIVSEMLTLTRKCLEKRKTTNLELIQAPFPSSLGWSESRQACGHMVPHALFLVTVPSHCRRKKRGGFSPPEYMYHSMSAVGRL